eukprot:3284062-Rhodomonas_salina.1
MSKYNWKNHPFEKLHETGWRCQLDRSRWRQAYYEAHQVAHGETWAHSYVSPCFNVPIDEAGNTDYSLLEFNQAVVALVLLCDKSFGAININTERGVFDAIDVLKMELVSFSIQVKNAAQLSHANPQQEKQQPAEVKGSNVDVSLGCSSSQWAQAQSVKDPEQRQP